MKSSSSSKDSPSASAESAISDTGETRVTALIGPLIEALRQASTGERLTLADEIARRLASGRPDQENVEMLIRTLSDEDWPVRWGSAHALGKAQIEAAGPALRQAVRDPQPRVARTAAWALGRIRDSEAVPDLEAAIQSSNTRLAAAAAWALGHTGTPEALEALMHALEGADSRTLRSLSLAFTEIGPEAVETLVELLQSGSVEERNRAATILSRFGASAAQMLLPLLQSESVKHRRAAAHILGTLKLKNSPASLREEIASALLRCLQDPDLRVRLNSARSLGALGIVSARAALETLLEGGPEEARVAANALASLGDPEAGPALHQSRERMNEDEKFAGARAAVEKALFRLGLTPAPERKSAPSVDRQKIPTRNDYLARVTPGLEAVAWEEVNSMLQGASLKEMGDGELRFTWRGNPQACAILRSVRQVYQGGSHPEEIPLAKRLRRYRVRTLPASIEPTTAYCLARLANLGERDVFLDLTCGTATIAIERALDGPARSILAGDIDPEALKAARENVSAGAQPVRLVQWDARQLPNRDRSVHAVVANLPYGKRSGAHSENETLYPAILAEIARVLRRSGTAVLLTTEKRLMQSCLSAVPELQVVSERPIEAGGLRPTLFVLVKDEASRKE